MQLWRMMMLKENVDYELVPGTGENWDVRLLTGDFTETVLNFTKLTVMEDAEHLSFNFEVVSSPDPTLNADDNYDLQQHAAAVLSAVLESAIVRGKSD
jgi:hypothetical protein